MPDDPPTDMDRALQRAASRWSLSRVLDGRLNSFGVHRSAGGLRIVLRIDPAPGRVVRCRLELNRTSLFLEKFGVDCYVSTALRWAFDDIQVVIAAGQE